MDITFKFDTENVDWELVREILQIVNMANYTAAIHKNAFVNSRTTVFAYDNDKLIGFGRALSDGAYQAALYDLAILPEYQGKGIGKKILHFLMEHNATCNFILYASIGKEPFYEKEKYRKMKTGMALFQNMEKMKEKGFTE